MDLKIYSNIVTRCRHYYDIKYPYLKYPIWENDGELSVMYSVPMVGLVEMYRQLGNGRPSTFFDCGCATGELIQQAEGLGIYATGIDIKQYPVTCEKQARYVADGKIQIKSILDMGTVKADLAYCNGTLTYMNTKTLPLALEKFRGVQMLIAIHNTTEDIRAARADGWELLHGEPRLIKSRDWWMKTFRKNGFDVSYNQLYGCFCALPNGR